MAVNRTGSNETKQNEQSILNTSYDREFGVLVTEGLTYNPVSSSIERTVVIGQGNASMVLSYDGDGNVNQIEKTVDGTTYTKTLTWVGQRLTEISAWV